MKRKFTRETDVQAAVLRVYRAAGCTPYRTATVQTRHTRAQPGLPDLIVFHHRVGVWFHEVKTDGGKLRPAQRSFREICKQCRVPHVVGGVQELYRFLWNKGIFAGGKTLADEWRDEVDA